MISVDSNYINFRGKNIKVDSVNIAGKTIVITGNIIKTAKVREQWDEDVEDPNVIIYELKKNKIKIDLFTFCQRLPEITPKYEYYFENVPIAAMRIGTYDEWIKSIPKKTRQNIKNAEKHGVIVEVVKFNDELVNGIMDIYNEVPVRQGKKFWHYGKDFETVKRDNSTYTDRCDFIAAFYNSKLIGFIKIVYTGSLAVTMQIIAKVQYRDKLKTTNLLIAKAVQLCEIKNVSYWDYGLWNDGSLSEFKRRNGFEKIPIPNYYVPFTIMGKIALKINLHHGIVGILPESIVARLKNIRKKWYSSWRKTTNTSEEL